MHRMITADGLQRTKVTINRLSAPGAPWPAVATEVAGQLRRLVGFDCFCLSQNDPLAPMPAGGVADNDVLSSQQRRFWQIEMQQPDVNKTCHLVTAPTPVAVLSHATDGDLARSTRWDELLGPGGVGDELRAALVLDGQWWGSLSLYRERRAAPFTAAAADAIARLAEPLAALARAAWTTPAPQRIEPLGPGTLVLTSDGRIASTTATGRAWLRRLHPAEQTNGTLLHAMCARLEGTAGPYPLTDTVHSLVRGADGSWIEVDASQLGTPVGPGTVAVTIQTARPAAVTELLARAYALTARERQVAQLGLAGLSTGDIGSTLFLSRHTVADHLKSVFAKTGVHTRHELRRRLAGQPV